MPQYWFRDLKGLSAKAGMHRFTWDVHYQALDGSTRLGGPNLPIASIGYNTIQQPTTPWANPGTHTARHTVNGKSYTQPIVVKADPRVKTPAVYMQQLYTLSRAAYDEAVTTRAAATQARALRDQIAKVLPQASGATAAALSAYDRRLDSLAGAATAAGRGGRGGGDDGAGGRGGVSGAPTDVTLSGASTALAGVMNLLQGADVRPTTVQLNAIAKAGAEGARVMARWNALSGTELAALNRSLTAAGLAAKGK